VPELDEKYVRRRTAGEGTAPHRAARSTGAAALAQPGKPAPVATRNRPNLTAAPAPVKPLADFQDANPLRRFALFAGLGLVFINFGTVSELLAYVLHINTYLLYVVGPPTIVGVLVTGGIGRTLRGRAAWYWLGFYSLMILATPFSSWPGGSASRVLDYARYSLPLLFVVGGLALTWDEVRKYFNVLAAAAVVTVLASRLFAASDDNGRLTLDSSGSIGNSNDLASHLVIVLPFLLFIVMDPKRKLLLKASLLGVIGYGIWVILGTASRGGLIALVVVFVFMVLRASASQRIVVLVCGIVLAMAVPVLLPAATLARLASLFGGQHEEAQESEDSRSYLFRQSVIFTLQHPLFGVGPEQFSNFEGKTRTAQGQIGEWHATHCAFTQVSSECGIPAAILFLLGIGSAGMTVNRIWRRARQQGFPEISRACLCYMTALVGYLATITFLANAYRFYLPAMIGLAIIIGTAGTRYMDENPRASVS
jgi:O-antigen ligase